MCKKALKVSVQKSEQHELSVLSQPLSSVEFSNALLFKQE